MCPASKPRSAKEQRRVPSPLWSASWLSLPSATTWEKVYCQTPLSPCTSHLKASQWLGLEGSEMDAAHPWEDAAQSHTYPGVGSNQGWQGWLPAMNMSLASSSQVSVLDPKGIIRTSVILLKKSPSMACENRCRGCLMKNKSSFSKSSLELLSDGRQLLHPAVEAKCTWKVQVVHKRSSACEWLVGKKCKRFSAVRQSWVLVLGTRRKMTMGGEAFPWTSNTLVCPT